MPGCNPTSIPAPSSMGWFSAEPSTDETASVDVGSVASASVTSSAEFKKSQLESALRLVKEADDEGE